MKNTKIQGHQEKVEVTDSALLVLFVSWCFQPLCLCASVRDFLLFCFAVGATSLSAADAPLADAAEKRDWGAVRVAD